MWYHKPCQESGVQIIGPHWKATVVLLSEQDVPVKWSLDISVYIHGLMMLSALSREASLRRGLRTVVTEETLNWPKD